MTKWSGRNKDRLPGILYKRFHSRKERRIFSASRFDIARRSPEDTGDLSHYEALDDDWVVVNQMLKYLKFGFGKVTDQVCEAIRLKKMSRQEAIELVKNTTANVPPGLSAVFAIIWR